MSGALVDDALRSGIVHEIAGLGFGLFKCQYLGKIQRELFQKPQVVQNILPAAEGVLAEKDRKLGLDAQRRA